MRPDSVSLLAVAGAAVAAVVVGMEMPYVGILFVLAGLSVWQADTAGMYRAIPPQKWKRGGRVAAAWTVCMLPVYAVFLYWWNWPGDMLMTAAVLCCFVRTAPRVIPLGIACIRHTRTGATA